jgi:hypothetical protein
MRARSRTRTDITSFLSSLRKESMDKYDWETSQNMKQNILKLGNWQHRAICCPLHESETFHVEAG